MSKTATTTKYDPYQHINDIIIARLEQGELPWVSRYSRNERNEMGPARNGESGRVYTGLNRLLLSLPGRYYTPKNIKDNGWLIKSGSKSFYAAFFKMWEKKTTVTTTDPETGEEVTKEVTERIPIPRLYNVFHESQIDFLEEGKKPVNVAADYDGTPVVDADVIFMRYRSLTGVNVDDQAEDPSYELGTDTIHIPERARYASPEGYYLDLFHEMVHSTGHGNRLARKMPAVAAHTRVCSFEELVATMGSAYLMNEADMDTLQVYDSVAEECQRWAKALRENDRHWLVWASSKATKAVHYILTGEKDDDKKNA